MTTFETDLTRGIKTLSRRDPILRPLIRKHGPPTFSPHTNYFDSLVDAIISQQITGRAAATILERMRRALGEGYGPEIVTAAPDELLRSAGVSPQKLGYLRSFCEHLGDGRLDLAELEGLDDDEIIARLTAIRGIGVWTAQMFLIFSLGRLDLLPSGDLGVRKGTRIAYGLQELPLPAQVEALSVERCWAPYRSIATWYLWRATEE
jgi:DNA-3-methyladenine glycosylase II